VPNNSGSRDRDDFEDKSEPMAVTTGMQKLVDGSGLTPKSVRRVLRKETKWTTFSVADDLLTAAGIHNDLTVVPNPKWNKEHWQAWHEEHSC